MPGRGRSRHKGTKADRPPRARTLFADGLPSTNQHAHRHALPAPIHNPVALPGRFADPDTDQ